jgi:hypothetical protein
MAGDFLLGETLDGGRYRLTEHLRGRGSQLLYLAKEAAGDGSEATCFVSVIWAPKGLAEAEVRAALEYSCEGVHALAFLGCFDAAGDDEERHIHQQQYCALVERVPEGEWLPRLTTAPLGAAAAAGLGSSVGRLLEAADQRGHCLVGLRPEYVWAQRRAGELVAVSVTGRNRDYFTHVGGRCLIPGQLFERLYLAPEVYTERGERRERDESLVFSLAIMIAEWATGAYPFPESWAGGNLRSLLEGRHAPLSVTPALAKLLALCLKPDPSHRPDLSYFLKRLSLLTPDDLADR